MKILVVGFALMSQTAFAQSSWVGAPIREAKCQSLDRHASGAVICTLPMVATTGGLGLVGHSANAHHLCQALGFSGFYFDRKDSSTYIQRGTFANGIGAAMYMESATRAYLSPSEVSYFTRVTCK